MWRCLPDRSHVPALITQDLRGCPGKPWPPAPNSSPAVPWDHGTACSHFQGRKCYMWLRTSYRDEFPWIPMVPHQFPSTDHGHSSCAPHWGLRAIHSSSFLLQHWHSCIWMAKAPQNSENSRLFDSHPACLTAALLGDSPNPLLCCTCFRLCCPSWASLCGDR